MVTNPGRALSEDQVCFDVVDARKIYAEIMSCKETDILVEKLNEKFALEIQSRNLLVENLTKRISLLEKQQKDEMERAKQYKLEWKNCGKALADCQKSKPSRIAWFGIGSASTLVVLLVITLL